MRETVKEMKRVIAARAGEGFYKSYIKNIKVAAVRRIPGHRLDWDEIDYTFEHKGKSYRINERIVPDEKGNKIFSAKKEWTLEEI